MKEIIRQLFIGYGSILLAPLNAIPTPVLRITLPPSDSTQGIAFDFSRISSDLSRAIEKMENENQLELKLNIEPAKA